VVIPDIHGWKKSYISYTHVPLVVSRSVDMEFISLYIFRKQVPVWIVA